MTILSTCKNEVGYKNLCKLNTLAFTEGFYFKPRIDLNLLEKHSEGLICLTACLAGRLPRILLDDLIADKYQKAVEYGLKIKIAIWLMVIFTLNCKIII